MLAQRRCSTSLPAPSLVIESIAGPRAGVRRHAPGARQAARRRAGGQTCRPSEQNPRDPESRAYASRQASAVTRIDTGQE